VFDEATLHESLEVLVGQPERQQQGQAGGAQGGRLSMSLGGAGQLAERLQGVLNAHLPEQRGQGRRMRLGCIVHDVPRCLRVQSLASPVADPDNARALPLHSLSAQPNTEKRLFKGR
jgi:hypothetical protein